MDKAHKMTGKNEMAGRGYGQIFCQAFDNSENSGLTEGEFSAGFRMAVDESSLTAGGTSTEERKY